MDRLRFFSCFPHCRSTLDELRRQQDLPQAGLRVFDLLDQDLRRLHAELVWKDWFQTLPDFNAYVVRKGQALSDYACDPLGWCKKCLVNIAKAGFFSSDRTIAEYDRDIWHLGQ